MAFLLVLLGHSFPDSAYEYVSPVTRVAHGSIYAFHMPLFFIISGYCMTHILVDDTISLKEQIKKRVTRLIIPYFVYSIVAIVPKLILAPFMYRVFDTGMIWKILIGESPSGTLWYVYTLFVVSIVFLLISHVIKSYLLWLIIALTTYFLYALIPFFHNNFFRFPIFFMGGWFSIFIGNGLQRLFCVYQNGCECSSGSSYFA